MAPKATKEAVARAAPLATARAAARRGPDGDRLMANVTRTTSVPGPISAAEDLW